MSNPDKFEAHSSRVESHLGESNWNLDRVTAADKVSLTFLGTNSLLISDGHTHLIIDPHFTRPSWPGGLPLPFIQIKPDLEIIRYTLERAGIEKLEAVLLTHTHYDHALDAPPVALLYGSHLAGSESACNLGRGAGIAENKLVSVLPGQPITFGSFIATYIESCHLPFPEWASRKAGVGQDIEKPLITPARMDAFKSGKVYALYLEHKLGRLLVLGSAGFIEGRLKDYPTDAVVLSVGGLDYPGRSYCKAFFKESVLVTGAKRVFISHWDDFTRPITSTSKVLKFTRRSMGMLQKLALEGDHSIKPLEVLQVWKKIYLFPAG